MEDFMVKFIPSIGVEDSFPVTTTISREPEGSIRGQLPLTNLVLLVVNGIQQNPVVLQFPTQCPDVEWHPFTRGVRGEVIFRRSITSPQGVGSGAVSGRFCPPHWDA